MESTTKIRRRVLNGNIAELSAFSDTLWYCPKKKLKVFVSSTFTDTHMERNLILDVILPFLREKASRMSIEVVILDMRWGIRNSATLGHRTWTECCNGILSCFQASGGLFFLSLQSHK